MPLGCGCFEQCIGPSLFVVQCAGNLQQLVLTAYKQSTNESAVWYLVTLLPYCCLDETLQMHLLLKRPILTLM